MSRRFALEGIHVLDFAWVGVGPITTKYLADNGADVIRVESAARPDVLRIGPPWKDAQPGINRSQFFASFNTSKKGITLDLSKPKARELVERLVPWADIIVESFTPKAMRNWGLDYENLLALRPDLIMLSTCMQGQTGPNALYPGFGQLMAALSGFYHISGYGPGSCAPPYGAYSDFIAPRFSACALLAALDYRRRTGKGQYIDMSQYEAAMQNLAPALIDYFAGGRVLGPRANGSDRYAPHGAYRCADEDGNERWIAIAVAGDDQWRSMLSSLGANSTDARFATMSERIENASALDEFVGSLTRRHNAHELTVRLQAARESPRIRSRTASIFTRMTTSSRSASGTGSITKKWAHRRTKVCRIGWAACLARCARRRQSWARTTMRFSAECSRSALKKSSS